MSQVKSEIRAEALRIQGTWPMSSGIREKEYMWHVTVTGDVVSDCQLMESVGLILNECCDCVLKLLPLLYLLCHFDGMRLLLGDCERLTGGTHSCRYYRTNWVTSGPRGAITLLHDVVSQ
jgi:hypothetical protein